MMALTPAEERVFTAYHEAGHLAAALAFRVMPRGATIRPSAEHLGLVITADRRNDGPEVSAESWLASLDRLGTHARAVELMAGLAAAKRKPAIFRRANMVNPIPESRLSPTLSALGYEAGNVPEMLAA